MGLAVPGLSWTPAPSQDTWKEAPASLWLTLQFLPGKSCARAWGDIWSHEDTCCVGQLLCAGPPWGQQPGPQLVKKWREVPVAEKRQREDRPLLGGLCELLCCRLRTGRTSPPQEGEGPCIGPGSLECWEDHIQGPLGPKARL